MPDTRCSMLDTRKMIIHPEKKSNFCLKRIRIVHKFLVSSIPDKRDLRLPRFTRLRYDQYPESKQVYVRQ